MELAPGSLIPARDRGFPIDEAFGPLFPDAVLPRGRVVGCSGPAATAVSLALVSRAVAVGSWLAVVGVEGIGVEAAAELGVTPARLVRIDVDGGHRDHRARVAWAERVAAAADGFELIITRPPPGAERVMRRVRQRLQARGVVLLALDPTGRSTTDRRAVAGDVEITTERVRWIGPDRGAGRLTARRAVVRVGGRRIPRPREHELWLPGPDGRVAPTGTGAPDSSDVDRRPEPRSEAPVELRAG